MALIPKSDTRIFYWFHSYSTKHYRPVAYVDMLRPNTTVYVSGKECETYRPRSEFGMQVMRRIDGEQFPGSIGTPRNPMNKTTAIAATALLVLATWVAFGPTLRNDFNHYDDQHYITDNEMVKSGLNLESLRYAFAAVVVSNWHPVTMISHMLDCELFGLDPGAHHAMNLFYHIVNVVLMFALFSLFSRKIWPGFFAALLFAVHPLRVESVAWAAERKDVLSAMFFLLTIISYRWYARRRSPARYAPFLVCACLGLMAKPMLVTVPLALLLLDYYPLKEFDISFSALFREKQYVKLSKLIAEKAPLFILSAVFSYIAYAVQQSDESVFEIPFIYRFWNAFGSYLLYLKKLVFPVNLAVFYPHPYTTGGFSPAAGVVSLALVSTITALAVVYRRRFRHLLAAWLWYLVLLVPVIGFVQVGDQAMADRYTYLPTMSLYPVVVWLGCRISRRRQAYRLPVVAAGVLLTVVLVLLTREQTKVWKDDPTLFSHATEATRNNYKMHYNLGIALRSRGKTAGALKHFLKAKEMNRGDEMVYMDISSLYLRAGMFDKVISTCNELISRNPNSWFGYYGRGLGHYFTGKIDLASNDFQTALRKNIDDINAVEQIIRLAVQARDTTLVSVAGSQALSHYAKEGKVEKRRTIKEMIAEFEADSSAVSARRQEQE